MAAATVDLATNVGVVDSNANISAAARVFRTTELLEIIILACDVHFMDLFVLQRTSRSFRDTIEGSSKLQKRMLFEIAPTSDLSGKVLINPLVTSGCFYPSKQKQYDNGDRDIILFGRSRGLEAGEDANINVFLRREGKSYTPDHYSRLSPGLRNDVHASWRRMQFAVPPLGMFSTSMRRQQLLPLHALEKWGTPTLELNYRIHCKNVTLGAVLDALEDTYHHERRPEWAWNGYDWQRNDATFKVLKTSSKHVWL